MLSTTTGYAILALSCMQSHENGSLIMVKEIAANTGIPKPYLHKLIHQFTKSGLVVSRRGYKGGVALTKDPRYVTLLEIANQVDGHQWTQKCLLGLASCSDERACPAHQFWSQERTEIFNQLSKTTLSDIQAFEQKNGKIVISLDDINKNEIRFQ